MSTASTLVFFLVLFSMSNASAWGSPFDIKNESFFDGDWEIASEHGNPVKNVKSNAHIRAWIDIIGFDNESIINGTRYVNGSPKDFAIVRRDAWHTSVSGVVVSFTTTYAGVYDGNNTTTASQTTNFHWKYKVHTLYGSHWRHVYEGPLTVSYTAESPETFNNAIDGYEITIVSYNNSVTPYTLICTPDRWNIIKTTIEYKNNLTHWHNQTGWVAVNDRKTEHVEFLNASQCIADSANMLTRRAGYTVINEAPLNWSLLDICVYTPYATHQNPALNITVINSKPLDYVQWEVMIIFLAVLGAFIIMSYSLLRRVRL